MEDERTDCAALLRDSGRPKDGGGEDEEGHQRERHADVDQHHEVWDVEKRPGHQFVFQIERGDDGDDQRRDAGKEDASRADPATLPMQASLLRRSTSRPRPGRRDVTPVLIRSCRLVPPRVEEIMP